LRKLHIAAGKVEEKEAFALPFFTSVARAADAFGGLPGVSMKIASSHCFSARFLHKNAG